MSAVSIHPAAIVALFAAMLFMCAWYERRNKNRRDSQTLAAIGGGLGLAAAATAIFH